eukprot:9736360-Ditylum_brightwellii.AAC.1
MDGNIVGVEDGASPGRGFVQKELTSASAITFSCASNGRSSKAVLSSSCAFTHDVLKEGIFCLM